MLDMVGIFVSQVLVAFLADHRLLSTDFRARMRGLYELALDRWRRYSVRTISLKYHESCLSAARAVRTPSGT